MKGLFLGLLTIDLHFFADHYPEENTKTKVSRFDSYIGGPATNAAITFGHLGGAARLITSIGEHSFRHMIMERLEKYHLDLTDMKAGVKTDPVFASVLTNTSSGERTVFSYKPKEEKSHEYLDEVSDYDIALFDGFYDETALDYARACHENGVITVFDGGSWKRNTDKLLPFIDIAICSADFMPPGVMCQEDVTAYLLNNGVKKAAITRGEMPIVVNEGEVNLLLQVPKIKPVDTLAAGDIFHGAFCFFYMHTKNFVQALEKASQIAALSCQHAGPRRWMEAQS